MRRISITFSLDDEYIKMLDELIDVLGYKNRSDMLKIWNDEKMEELPNILEEQENNLKKDIDQTFQDMVKKNQKKMEKSDIERLVPKRDSSSEELRSIKEQAEILEEMTKKEDPDITATLRNFRATG